MQQFQEFQGSMMQALMQGDASMCPYLVLRVRRGEHLLHDTLRQVRHSGVDASWSDSGAGRATRPVLWRGCSMDVVAPARCTTLCVAPAAAGSQGVWL